jgi:hypothetical protein
MNGKDVMDALANIDDDLILDAKSQPRAIPRWLKWGSMAVCICCAVLLTFLCVEKLRSGGEDTGKALAPGSEQTEPAFSEASSAEEETAIPEESAERNAGMEAISVLDYTDFNYFDCEGNLILIDGSYYTLTDNGAESVKLQNVSTEIELYGTWTVDFDYAVLDGELVLHNNASREKYTIIDGKQVTLAEYTSADYGPSDSRTWYTATGATAASIPGRNDLVTLSIYLEGQEHVESCEYPLFYDLSTGEILDPLSNVPDLYSYGSLLGISINTSLTQGIVEVLVVGDLTHEDEYIAYLCDLETGEMWSLDDRLAEFLPEDTEDGTTYELVNANRAWADDDTVLFWVRERTPNGEGWDSTMWLGAYNCSTETLDYLRQGVEDSFMFQDGSCPYLMGFIHDATSYLVVDTATGNCYVLEKDFTAYSWFGGYQTHDRDLSFDSDLELYLFDGPSHSYAVLPFAPEQLQGELSDVYLPTDDWLCVQTDTQLYFYRIPDSLGWIEMEEDPAS